MWKDVLGYEGIYEVSSDGIVRSLDRKLIFSNGIEHFREGKILKQNISSGYYYVELNYMGKSRKKNVHRLVCEAFHTKVPGKNIVNHINGDKLDNNYINLEWCNYSENSIHAHQNGLTTNIGESARDAILSIEEVIEIRTDTQLSYTKLAAKYGVSKSTIADIKKNRSWKYIDVQTEYVDDEIDMDKFLTLLENKRKELNLNFGELAKFIGVQHSTLNRWKRGEITPRMNTVFQVSQTLNLNIENFFVK